MSNATSPHNFSEGTEDDLTFIRNELLQNKYAMFLRKINSTFPDDILLEFIKPTQTIYNIPYGWFTGLVLCLVSFLYMLTFPSCSTFDTRNEGCHWFIC